MAYSWRVQLVDTDTEEVAWQVRSYRPVREDLFTFPASPINDGRQDAELAVPAELASQLYRLAFGSDR